MGNDSKNSNAAPADYFKGGGEMGERIRRFDWAQTPLGAPETWQQSLKTAVRLMLDSRYPMFVWWGEQLVCLYNDAYIPILGNRHPNALGLSGYQIWHELWDIAGPQAEAVLKNGEATWNDELPFVMERNGRPEETYVTFSYSPIADDAGNIGGLFCVCNEETQKVLNRRRLKTLRDLGERTLEESKTIEDACRAACETLAENPFDIPFALAYLLDADGKTARLMEALRVENNSAVAPLVLEIKTEQDIWRFGDVLEEGGGRLMPEIDQKFAGKISAGKWDDDFTRQAYVVPLAKAGIQDFPAGFLVAGLSPRLEFDKEYRDFIELAAGHIATAIANARALEEERNRAESLAELDRAKTEFFSNVSHEFRTPLTLMLGNLEEVLAKDGQLPESEKQQIETAHRNSLRLLKLVNTLLDFSRIEANRQQADFEPTDLAKFTAELASNFRSAIEKAGIRLTVDCPPLSQEISIDREMWEKIVLNLISNAFKFTFSGEIKVSLTETDENAVLQISDTGTGISEENLPHVFERFHRVAGARSRTHEGTGIGLALVQELVKLHDGAISAESEIDKGTTFTISIPRARKRNSETERKVKKAAQASNAWQSYLLDSEAGESPESNYVSPSPFLPFASSASILLADDNADMREYVRRLLEQNGYRVSAVPNGEAALEILEESKPDLILSDVMMPFLDGFGLLERVRESEKTREIPVILLSARAGEEAKVEGLGAGADDYLIKPFSAKELIARVDANMKLARLRGESARQERELRRLAETAQEKLEGVLSSVSDAFAALDRDFRYLYVNDAATEMSGIRREDFIGKTVWEIFPDLIGTTLEEAFRRAMSERQPASLEYLYPAWNRWFEYRLYPTDDGLTILIAEITGKKQTEEKIRESEERYRILAETASDAIIRIDENSTIQYVNTAAERIFGFAAEEMLNQSLTMLMPEEMRRQHRAGFGRYLKTGKRNLNWESIEVPARHKDGHLFPLEISFGEYNREGKRFFIGIARDITERKAAEQAVRESEEKFRDLANSISQFAWMADASGHIFWYNERWFEYTGTTLETMQGWGWQKVHHPEEVERVTEKFKRHIASGEIWEDTFPLRSRAGEYRWFLSRALPIRDENGRIVRWFGTNTDVEEIRQARLQAENANRLKDEFLATVSHELRTPLNAILGWSSMLQSGKANEEIRRRADETIYRSAKSQAQLIEDLLDVSRIITGKMRLEARPVHLSAIVESAVNTVRPAAEAKSIRLETFLDDGKSCVITGDAQRLQQIVWNLISNAVKFTADGGRVEVKLETDDSYARLIVSDTGKGIEPQFLPFLFERFSQEDGSTTRRHGGLGLGLAIVRHLVELHGGKISAASAGMNQGSTFTVELPLLSPDIEAKESSNGKSKNIRESLSDGFSAEENNHARQLTDIRVLLVDDELDTLELLDAALSAEGANVRVASSAADAFEIFEDWKPDVLVSDIAMPDEDGYSLLKRVRAFSPDEGGRTPAIAMTAYVRVEDRMRVLKSGFQMYVPKPAEPFELTTAIVNLVEKKKS